MVTLEEGHSTRGRARMLFEMLQGEIVADGWQDEHVKQSFDLCLSCKACKSECPTNVDIATYKAEFLSHYFEQHRRPLHAYAFGMIDKWARVASIAPALANFIGRAPGASSIMRTVLDLARERTLPPFARVSFRNWARRRGVATVWSPDGAAGTDTTVAGAGDRHVILWADTFNNYFHPTIAQAALEVLEAAGFSVSVPREHLCCGRPLYDFGMLDRAAHYLHRVMRALGPEIDQGWPIVVLEPSCASVFRDELRNLFPTEPRAIRLSNQTFLFGEFLAQHAREYEPPRLPQRVLLHSHCHEKAVLKSGADAALFRRMGADVQTLDSGCCGMAGPFGFEADKFLISRAIGERALLPAVRHAKADTIIVSNGFSCREQIVQGTARRVMHTAEVLSDAMKTRRAQ
jgi:Fe-S oxidoreductase